MTSYIVSTMHKEKECQQACSEIEGFAKTVYEMGLKIMNDSFMYGCPSGTHTGHAIIEADNIEAVNSAVNKLSTGETVAHQLTMWDLHEMR